jgi:hypothetical protein
MEKEFVTYEQALALKELGFDEMCFGFYRSPIIELMRCRNSEPWMGNSVVSAPLKQQVFRWFRENGYMIDICPNFEDGLYYFGICYKHKFLFETDYEYSIYEEAENACIDKLIEIAKQQ